MGHPARRMLEPQRVQPMKRDQRAAQASPAKPLSCCDPPTHSHTLVSHSYDADPTKGGNHRFTESFRLEKTLKIINSKHKFITMSLAPSMMPYNQNMPAIPWWKTGSQCISDHTQGWKKSLSKAWMKLQLNTSSSVPASRA